MIIEIHLKTNIKINLHKLAQIQKDIEKEFASSAKYDRKSFGGQIFLIKQNNQHDLIKLITLAWYGRRTF